MKKTNQFSLLALLLLLLLISCQKKENISPDSSPDEILSLKDAILKMGFKEEDIVEKEEYFLVEGDIMFKKDTASTRDIINSQKTMQARTTNTVYHSNSQISIYVDPSVSNWASAVDDAIDAYNNLDNTIIILTRTSSPSNARIIVKSGVFPDPTTVGSAGFPINGFAYGEILLNNNYSYYTQSQKQLVVAHEIGHCLGLRHTDWSIGEDVGGPGETPGPEGAIQIPNTPSSDSYSIMNHNIGGVFWNGFSQYDIIALRYLFPITINVGISGPSTGNNEDLYSFSTSASGGTSPYTYTWYYSYNNYTEPAEFWFTGPSINDINLPYQMDLHIKVIAIDAAGRAGIGYKYVMNRGRTTP